MTCLACGAQAHPRPICRSCWKVAPRSVKADVLRAEGAEDPEWWALCLALAEMVQIKQAAKETRR